MKDQVRARVASAIAAAAKNKNITSVYDYDSSAYRNVTARVSNGRLDGYDYDTGTHFSGNNSLAGKLAFYDYDTSQHVDLKLDGSRFSGYDYHSGSHFSGTINSSSISLYDYGSSQYHNYSA